MENDFKVARLAAGLTQKGMSELMKIPFRTIQQWESRERTPPPYVRRFVLNELKMIAELKMDKSLENKS